MKKFVYVIISASLFAACNVGELEFDNLEVTPIEGPFVFPLGQATYVMRDILSKQTGDSLSFEEDSTSLYTLFYYDTIRYSTPNDFVQIDNIQIIDTLESVPVGTAPTSVNGSYLLEGFEYNPTKDEQLDSIFYATGDLVITTSTNMDATVNYSFTFPSTVELGSNTPITVSGTINGVPGATTYVQDTQTESLVGYKTELIDPSGDNSFDIELDLEVILSGTQSTNGLEDFAFNITFANQTFSLIYGKFGRDTVQVGNQSLEIDFFSQAAREGITFGNPSMTFDFRNSFGVPVGIDFSGLHAVDADGNQTFLTGNIANNPPVIEGSDVNSPGISTPGETVQTIVEIDRTNSSIIKLFGSSPEQLVFDVKGRSNPENQTDLNYLQPTSEISAYVAIEIPMEVQLEDYQETGTFSLRNGFDASNLDSAFIRLVTLNELPFTGTVSLEVQAEDSTVLFPITDESDPRYDSATTNHPTQIERLTNIPVIKAPLINVNGDVTDPSGETHDVALTNEEVQLLSGAARIVITMTLNTPASQTSRDIYVKILADYTLTLKVGIGARFNLDL